MTLQRIASMGKDLVDFLKRFSRFFKRPEPRKLLKAYVQGQLSPCERKSVEPMAIHTGTASRTLQRFLESIEWDEEGLRDECQRIVADEHAHPQAIGVIDESAVPKSGSHTAGADRQWCGHKGKVDNCTVGVHTVYATEDLHVMIDSDLYLSKNWADNAELRREAKIPDDVEFRTKPKIAADQIKRSLGNGIKVAAWTWDELYSRDPKFLDEVQRLEQHFVGEVSVNFRGWIKLPQVLHALPRNSSRRGRRKKYPCLGRRRPTCEVQNLLKYSDVFRKQPWVPYRIKDGEKGPAVWEVKWSRFHRKTSDALPSKPGCLIVARNVLNPDEVKYFFADQVPGEGRVTLQWLLWVAFRRWPVERCFREAKKELGMDHYEVRGWRCIHRHFHVTTLSHLFCARTRQQFAGSAKDGKLTIEQVRSAVNLWLSVADLPPSNQRQRLKRELDKMHYHQRRNEQARRSHTKTKIQRLSDLGIDVEALPSCIPNDTS